MFRFVDAEFGGLDVLVNNAGVGVFRPVRELSIEEWEYTMETNLTARFIAAVKLCSDLEPEGRGYIVNISSLAGKNAFAGGAAYNASKFGLTGFSEAMMLDVEEARTCGSATSCREASRRNLAGETLRPDDAIGRSAPKTWPK